jgi:hypothetical protein|tara:strand:- start:14124 stop:14297 length:174 start_codon:yes stop_codon:yes gene_type:complete
MSNKDRKKIKFNRLEREFMFDLVTEFLDSIQDQKDPEAKAVYDLVFGIAVKLGALRE